MKLFTKSLAVASVAAAAFALPMTASAGDYRKCKDTEATIAGGLIGGSLGTVIGEEIAGRGDRTEGAIAGAVIGGIIGAAVGDGASDCEKDGRIYRGGRAISTAHTPAYQTVNYHSSGSRNRGYQPNHRGYRNQGYNRGHNNWGYNDRNRSHNNYSPQYDRQLRQIDRRIAQLRAELDDLKRAKRYQHRGRSIQRRINDVGYELDRLKSERRRIKRARDNYRSHTRDYRDQNRRGHYHGRTICYSNH